LALRPDEEIQGLQVSVMKNVLQRVAAKAASVISNARVRWTLAGITAVLFVRSYFVRELFTIEAVFAVVCVAVLLVGGAVYLLGSVVISWFQQSEQKIESAHPVWSEGSSK
jgi:hypothetical protein